MGACSSKPKTTEFEGPTEPLKETEDVAADRSVDAAQQNEPPSKEGGASTDADTKAVQETRELIASKDEEPLVKGLLSTEEEVSHSVKAEAGDVSGEAGDSTAETGKVDAGDVQKVDAGVGFADNKEVSDKASAVDSGVGGDQDKLFEDKAVVLDEAGAGVEGTGDAYIDKGVAADEEKRLESSDKDSGGAPTHDKQPRNSQDINKSPGAESPIIGVVQPAEPIHFDDVSESVGSATLETPAHVESTVCELPVEIERDVLTGTNIGEDGVGLTEEAANLSSSLPQEAPEEKEEVLHVNSKVSPLSVGGADDARGEEVPLASANVQDQPSVEDATKPETIKYPQSRVDESTSEPQEENAIEESARESHAEVSENEGNAEEVNEPEPEALKVVEGIDAKTPTKPKAETTSEEAIERQSEGIADEPNASDVQVQALAIEEPVEDGKPEATPDEAVAEPSAVTEREEKVEEPHMEKAATSEKKMDSVDGKNLESLGEQAKSLSGEGDVAFEDASDVPLRTESSTIELGDAPKS